jgi:hypothetical protein
VQAEVKNSAAASSPAAAVFVNEVFMGRSGIVAEPPRRFPNESIERSHEPPTDFANWLCAMTGSSAPEAERLEKPLQRAGQRLRPTA